MYIRSKTPSAKRRQLEALGIGYPLSGAKPALLKTDEEFFLKF